MKLFSFVEPNNLQNRAGNFQPKIDCINKSFLSKLQLNGKTSKLGKGKNQNEQIMSE